MKSAYQLASEIKKTILNGTIEDAAKLINEDRSSLIVKASSVCESPSKEKILSLQNELLCTASEKTH